MESPPVVAPAPSVAPQDASSLVNILSKVDVSPAVLLSALSKVQGQESQDGERSEESFPLTENRYLYMFDRFTKMSSNTSLCSALLH